MPYVVVLFSLNLQGLVLLRCLGVNHVWYFDQLNIFFIGSLKGLLLMVAFLFKAETDLIEVIRNKLLESSPILFRSNLEIFEVRLLKIFVQSCHHPSLNVIIVDKSAND